MKQIRNELGELRYKLARRPIGTSYWLSEFLLGVLMQRGNESIELFDLKELIKRGIL